MNVNIRRSTSDEAIKIGQLARQFPSYLQSLGDQTEFKFNAEVYLRDGFGADPAFTGLVAEVEGRVIGHLLTISDMMPIGQFG
jgi:hypothetical protein